VEAGLARRVAFGRSLEGVVPARSLDSVQVADVIDAFVPQPEEQMRQRPIEVIVEGVVSSFRDAGFEAVGDSTMLEVVTKMEGGPATA
jgi:hypothetical protein